MKYTDNKYIAKKSRKNFGKTLCIILMVIFTAVMIADIGNLFLTPARNQMNFGPGSGFQMPEENEMPDFQIPEGVFGGGEPVGLPEGEMPSFDNGGNRDFGRGGFLQTARNAWLPILIVCALGDPNIRRAILKPKLAL